MARIKEVVIGTTTEGRVARAVGVGAIAAAGALAIGLSNRDGSPRGAQTLENTSTPTGTPVVSSEYATAFMAATFQKEIQLTGTKGAIVIAPDATPTEVPKTATVAKPAETQPATPKPEITATKNTKPYDYLFPLGETVGENKDGIIDVDATKVRSILKKGLTAQEQKNQSGSKTDRDNWITEMLGTPEGNKGLSTSHELNFWLKPNEGGRGWTPAAADHVWTREELADIKSSNFFAVKESEKGTNSQAGILTRVNNVEASVMRLVAERELQAAGKVNISQDDQLKYLSDVSVEKALKEQSAQLLRTVGYVVQPQTMPSVADAFNPNFNRKPKAFRLFVSNAAQSTSRDPQREGGSCVNYIPGLEKQTPNNDENMWFSDSESYVFVAFTSTTNPDGTKGVTDLDVMRMTDKPDTVWRGRIPNVADTEKVQREADMGRWITWCAIQLERTQAPPTNAPPAQLPVSQGGGEQPKPPEQPQQPTGAPPKPPELPTNAPKNPDHFQSAPPGPAPKPTEIP